jgi:diguanylate cyclase (GGDEF)-like protein
MAAIHPRSPAVRALIDDLATFADDASASLQELVARVPACFDMDRAYVARISPDGTRFSVTQASTGTGNDLLGYTQSIARLPAFVRRCLATGSQGTIGDTATFPFTAQQRHMLWYEGMGATIVSPFSASGSVIGALIVDSYKGPRRWQPPFLAGLVALAEAIGARVGLARSGAHLSDGIQLGDDALMRQNILANLAKSLEGSTDPDETSRGVALALGELPGVKSAIHITAANTAGTPLQAVAAESLLMRASGEAATVALPLVLHGERFGAIELVLSGTKLSAADEQFLRTVGVFASSAYAGALRRKRPRNESLVDPISALPNYRAIQEVLVEGVAVAKAGRQSLAVWLLEIDGLDAINHEHGYAIGDDVVGFIGRTLEAAVVPRGTAGRFSGAVFLGVFPATTAAEATTAARILLERTAQRLPMHLPPIGLSVGVATFPDNAFNHDELVRYARIALYAAKRVDGTRVVMAQSGDEVWERNARAALTEALAETLAPLSTNIRQ